MKVFLSLVILFTIFTSSCSNPHIDVKKKPVIVVAPPVGGDPSDPTDTTDPTDPYDPTDPTDPEPTLDFKFYIGDAVDGRNGRVTTGFWADTQVANPGQFITEDFETFAPSNTHLEITNQDFYSLFYTLHHKVVALPGYRAENDLDSLASLENYVFAIERPLIQDGVSSAGAGLDSLTASAETADALLWSFSSPVQFWGIDSLDYESSAEIPGIMRLFDCDKKLLVSKNVIYPNQENGNKEWHFVGFKATRPSVCYVLLSIGDYLPSNTGHRAIGIESFYYGIH